MKILLAALGLLVFGGVPAGPAKRRRSAAVPANEYYTCCHADRSQSGDQRLVSAAGWRAKPAYHLENPNPREARVQLDEKGLVIFQGRDRYRCDFASLEQGRSSQLIYYPLCDGHLYLRNPAKGSRTALEASAEFLRDQVWGGEKVVILFHHLLGERYRETADLKSGVGMKEGNIAPESPLPALIDPSFSTRQVTPGNLGIALGKSALTPGAWYAAEGNTGTWLSVLQPNFIAPSILQSYRKLASGLDHVEAASLCYLIAFDLDRFDLGYALGTEHPQVGWSNRVPASMRTRALPGPDGIANIAPLVSTGLSRPDEGATRSPRSPAASSASTAHSDTVISRSSITAAITASSKTAWCSVSCEPGLSTSTCSTMVGRHEDVDESGNALLPESDMRGRTACR